MEFSSEDMGDSDVIRLFRKLSVLGISCIHSLFIDISWAGMPMASCGWTEAFLVLILLEIMFTWSGLGLMLNTHLGGRHLILIPT